MIQLIRTILRPELELGPSVLKKPGYMKGEEGTHSLKAYEIHYGWKTTDWKIPDTNLNWEGGDRIPTGV